MAARCMSAIGDVDTIARQFERRRQKVNCEVPIFLYSSMPMKIVSCFNIPASHLVNRPHRL